MPELPEVETIARALHSAATGQSIVKIDFRRKNVLQKPEADIRRTVLQKTITRVYRRGKYIIFEFADSAQMTAHLRMTGKFIHVQTPGEPLHVHDRVIFYLSDGSGLRFNDARTLGKINVCASPAGLSAITGPIGAEPLADEYRTFSLYSLTRGRRQPIKVLLMDGTQIAGVGNIYAAEVLFRAGVHPAEPACRLTQKQADSIQAHIPQIFREALKHNGTSISDFRRVDNKTGKFQNFLRVYGKEGNPCTVCGIAIARIKQQQRSSYFCPRCQPLLP